jgi:membrane peptidoglycan carboxypeptidase
MSKLGGLILALAAIAAALWLAYGMLTTDLPSVDDLAARVHGRLANRGDPYTHLDQIPEIVRESTIVTEDVRFTSNTGIDPRGILRAVIDDVTGRCLCEGASTITQQLAKQIYFEGDDAGLRRKFGTIVLAFQIDRGYSKADILEFYLNTAYYGHGAYGVGAATMAYWKRPVSKVDLAQAAMLAGLPQAPSDYDPIAHPDAARQRRSQVLSRMLDFGLISEADLERASAQPVATALPSPGTIRPPQPL